MAHDFQLTERIPPTNSELEQGYNLIAEQVGNLKAQVAVLIAKTAKQESQINALLSGNAYLTQKIKELEKYHATIPFEEYRG